MAMKKHTGKTELREWMDEQYRKTPALRERVNALVEEMSVEQGLIALREERSLSQRALADLIGVRQPVIARIESGKARNLELKTVVRIAAGLGARVKILLQKEEAGDRAKSAKRKRPHALAPTRPTTNARRARRLRARTAVPMA